MYKNIVFTSQELPYPYEEELRRRQATIKRKMKVADDYMRQHVGRRRGTRWTFGVGGTLADAN
uniref:Uncharacterized protein n=1 Tax=viral metagenome TaxID=1070528 RepID=A0A6C0CS48_9ZZZZ